MFEKYGRQCILHDGCYSLPAHTTQKIGKENENFLLAQSNVNLTSLITFEPASWCTHQNTHYSGTVWTTSSPFGDVIA